MTVIVYPDITSIPEEHKPDESNWPIIQKWLDRGDGCAIYMNADLGSRDLGHCKYVSFGSEQAQLEVPFEDLPKTLPDIGHAINWRYQLCAVVMT